MARNRDSAKKAGASFERLIADHLKFALGSAAIDRRVKYGAGDRGDIAGVFTLAGGGVVLECKDYGGVFHVGTWLAEAKREKHNDPDAVAGVVVAKRRGTTDPAEQVVLMTVRDLVALLSCSPRPLYHLERAKEVGNVA